MQSVRSTGPASKPSTPSNLQATPIVIKQLSQSRPQDTRTEELSQMFHRSRSKALQTSPATSSTPSTSTTVHPVNGYSQSFSTTNPSIGVDVKSASPMQAPGRNLVKNLVNNIYENNSVNSQASPVLAARSSFRTSSNRSQDTPSGPSTASSNRSFQPLKNSNDLQHYVYDNNSKNFSPSLDRKSVTRASLPVNYRSGSAMSSGSSNASNSARVDNSYGVINSVKSANSSAMDNNKNILATHHEQIGSITWIEILEPKSKTKMFANLSSGECRWEEPKGVPVLRANNPNVVQWWELFDPKTQRFYYYSAKDFKTIWQKPTSPNAVIVPLAKLQILKQNSQHGLTESFDSGAGNSSGHVTPNSPSLSSPNHINSRLKWNAFQGPFGPVSAPVMVDSATQTTHSSISRPMLVSRWTQTTNQAPTTIDKRLNSLRPKLNGQLRAPGTHHPQQPLQFQQQQPSLQHYLLSEARFAKGRLSHVNNGQVYNKFDHHAQQLHEQQQQQQQHHPEDLYDQVYGQTNDFYDLVPAGNNQHSVGVGGNSGEFYDDVYDDANDEMLYDDYYDEFLDDEDDDFDESDFSCDADDEFVDGSIATEDDDDDEDDEEEDDEIIEDDGSEYHFEHDSDSFGARTRSSHDGSTEYVNQNPKANLAKICKPRSSPSDYYSQQSNIHPQAYHQMNQVQRKQTQQHHHPSQQAQHAQQAATSPNREQIEGIRMSASFTACDFKRNALGRSSYTPAMSQQYQQQLQAYSNPFNSGSLRSSTSRIADKISLFNKNPQQGSPQQQQQQASPSPMIVHRIPSNQASTPIDRSSVTQQNVQNYFQQQKQHSQNQHLSNQQSQQQQQQHQQQLQQQAQPSKSHSMTTISANLANINLKTDGYITENYYNMPPSGDDEPRFVSQPPQQQHHHAVDGSGSGNTPKLPKRNYPLTKVHSTTSAIVSPTFEHHPQPQSSPLQPSPIEQSRNRTLNHSLSLGGTGQSMQVYNNDPQFAGTFPSFDDSHLIMLNKTQQPQAGQIKPPSHGKKKNKTEKSNEKSANKSKPTKKVNESKVMKKTSPGKGDVGLPSNTSIESFAKENVARHRKGGIFSKKKTLKSMLVHTKKPLKKPMISTISDALLVKESVNCFKLIQIFMGDRPASPQHNPEMEHEAFSGTLSDENLLLRLINVCVQLVPLRDEVLVQVARQVTQNPSPESEQRGLELMCVLLWYFTASNKLSAHLHAFLSAHRNAFTPIVRRKFEQQAHRARHTHSHLFFRKPHSAEEVAKVLRCVRTQHSGLFGETLSDGLIIKELMQSVPDNKRTIPWPIVMLSEALLENRHEDREGMFRCVGDMDDVHRLKMKIDTTLQSDPKFLDSIGFGSRKAPKLTDNHDLHVIASTLKLYFRELREAAIPAELYNDALECAHSPGKACSLIDKLSSVNKSTIYYLINFLQLFSKPEHVRDTKMDDANLSMVWAPNLLRSLNPNNSPIAAGPNALQLSTTKSANIYEQTRAEMSLIRTLIQHLTTK